MYKTVLGRFGFVYLTLYSLRGVVWWVPFVGGWLAGAVGAWERILVALVGCLLGLRGPIARPAMTGSGDTLFDWMRVLALLVFSAGAAIVWSVATRRRSVCHRVPAELLRIYLRYVVGGSMLSYGLSKVFRSQFSSLDTFQMMQTYGDSSPMGLLWRFMDHSAPYTIFCGAVETLGGVLLFHRRTATLGALVTAAAMTNVVLLNFSYDVPVKQYSTHLLVMALVVAAPDAGRVARVLLGRSAPAASPRTSWMRNVPVTIDAAVGVVLTLSSVSEEVQARRQTTPPSPLAGYYEVTTFAEDGIERPPLTTDAARWRSFAIGSYDRCGIRTMTGVAKQYQVEDDRAAHVLRLTSPSSDPITLAYVREGAKLRLAGKVGGKEVAVETNRVDGSQLLLASRGFHLVQEYPFNR